MVRIRNITVFLGALALYIICLDRGASLWDCPEYILVAWRMEIGHPPGNPTWQLMANVFSHLGASPAHAAIIINATSALAMALASLFLSGIIYLFLRGSLFRGTSRGDLLWANVCAGAGALCYAWCDSAIFSAVEAEVYALSAMFTALMLWLALRWALWRSKGEVGKSRRYIILIAYLAGLGVGVHELNFLILPAIALIYYYGSKRYPLGTGQTGARRLVPSYGAMLTLLWSAVLFCVGATTYLIVPIRAAANPPVNTGNPSTWESFKSYYLRDQYGSKPLLYGKTPYSKPLLEEKMRPDGTFDYSRYYIREKERGKRENVYPDELDMWFPRMTSSLESDIEFYEAWAGMTPDRMVPVKASQAVDSAGNQVGKFNPLTGEREMRDTYRPTYWQQTRYLLGYQIGYMYMRYLLWNFSGRQNNVRSTGEVEHGNFLTGIPPIDDAMLGPQKNLPPNLKERNVGYNRYFMIPFLLGILGIIALIRSGRSGRRICLINAVFFLFTGILIVIYLNQDPGEVRERDYSFLGSYMAFAVWIGCGMGAVVRWILKLRFRSRKAKRLPAAAALLFCAAIPLQMLSQTYNDHDRSSQPGAEAAAHRYLDPLPPNAILLANGDNMIFPTWYGQEVLGLRRDVSIVAVPYLSTEWYRNQLRRPGEGSLPVDITDTIPEGPGSVKDRLIRDIIDRNSPGRPVYGLESNGKMERKE